jgi:YebC/PmpR family DNA-binding regulatory protein
MSGHSKWHTIKHKKGAADAKRGKVFTRIIKELTVAARNGGGDPGSNPRLRTIIAEAKASNMPRENIERAIRRGTGEEPGVSYEEITYEGYGPGGVALMIESVTDNKNRTVGEIRHLLSKHAGNLAAENSVAWMFSRKGQVVVEKDKADEETLLNAALEAGADDMNDDGERLGDRVRAGALRGRARRGQGAGRRAGERRSRDDSAELRQAAGQGGAADAEADGVLDDHDDVQHVWANFDIEEKEIEASLA